MSNKDQNKKTQKPKTIKELRQQVAIKTAPNHSLLQLYRRSK